MPPRWPASPRCSWTVRERAPDLFVPAAGTLAAALADAAAPTESPVDPSEPVYAALGEWALDAESEPIERMRRDCLRFQSALTRGTLRLYADDAEGCAAQLLALQRFNFLQLAVLASLSARGQGEGGVVRTLPTPEYPTFMEIFRTTIESHRQEGKQLGLLLLQVAKVEQVDSLLGMQRGEAFMLRVTRRMREGVLRKQDQLGRVSRDQLACLLPRIAGEGVAILAANKILGRAGGADSDRRPLVRAGRGDRHRDVPGPRRRPADAGPQRQARGARRARQDGAGRRLRIGARRKRGAEGALRGAAAARAGGRRPRDRVRAAARSRLRQDRRARLRAAAGRTRSWARCRRRGRSRRPNPRAWSGS